jgi:hypothetical protein
MIQATGSSGEVMLLTKLEAQELGNALLDASLYEDQTKPIYVCQMDTGEMFTVRTDPDDGHDNGFKTIAYIK